MDSSSLRISSLEKEGMFHASKWLKHPLLIDLQEMQSLLEEIGDCFICHASGVVDKADAFVSKEKLLEVYSSYIEATREGLSVDEREMRRFFCNYFTYDLSCLYAVPVTGDRLLIKVAKPVVQMQFHHFFPSTMDGKFHSMVMTGDSVHWGVQFSFPQIFEDPKTHQFFKVNEQDFSNTLLFKKIVRWLRFSTVPTPFIFEGVRTRVPFRIGKSCFSWIQNHSALKAKGIIVDT